MAKIVKQSNFRVVVEPNVHHGWFWRKSDEEIAKEEKRTCENIVEQIRRHVDDVHNIQIDWDTETLCSHCGLGWDVAEDGTPNCCQDAIDEHEAAKVAQ